MKTAVFVLFSIIQISAFNVTPLHADNIPKSKFVDAIIGEAEGEGYDGMLAVACAIRNRGTLTGVYGAKSRRVTLRQYSSHTFVLAVRAYEESAKTDIVNGASVWGNNSDIQLFKKTEWFKHYRFVKKIGNHSFYRKE